ncbi:MAG: family 10 glycosylhydrolase [Anaerolineae bacterium]|nr:family 10 glycosylhydrolase [Anaerolineae bacterium]
MRVLRDRHLSKHYPLILLGMIILCAAGCIPKSYTTGIEMPVATPAIANTGSPQSLTEDTHVYLPWVMRILPPLQTRGIWVFAENMQSPQATDQILAKVIRGNFNTIFVNVVRNGKTYYDSQWLPRSDDLPVGFDPLTYLLPKAHAAGIEVHAWFIVGQIGWPTLASEPVSVLQAHPEWMAINACGTQSKWLNAAHPGARDFIRAVVAEFIQKYTVDGVQLDYIRYPGEGWSFDDYSRSQFQALYNLDPENLRQATLPAYAYYTGHPLLWPSTAQVLAVFDSGDPALILNEFGDGETIVFNWDVSRCEVGAAGVILQRSLERFTATSSNVYLLQDAGSSDASFLNAQAWIRNLGWEPAVTPSAVVSTLSPAGVLVIPNVYSISVSLAEDLSNFVWGGGNVIFLDGPIYSIHIAQIRGLTGMQMRGKTFARNGRWLLAQQSHPLLPTADPVWNETMAAQWNEFRQSGVTQWVQSIREETNLGGLSLTAAVFTDQQSAAMVGQDWHAWLAADLVNATLPMAYAQSFDDLAQYLAEWKNSPYLSRIIPALIAYDLDTGQPKPVQAVLGEIAMVRASGAKGVALFDMNHVDEALLDALRTGPFAPEGYSSLH